jgi:hypothetical protein
MAKYLHDSSRLKGHSSFSHLGTEDMPIPVFQCHEGMNRWTRIVLIFRAKQRLEWGYLSSIGTVVRTKFKFNTTLFASEVHFSLS